jgi:nitrate reductase NapD
MPVSGIVVTCVPNSAESVAVKLAQLKGVEVHGVLPDGRIVAVVEADSVDGEVELVSGLEDSSPIIISSRSKRSSRQGCSFFVTLSARRMRWDGPGGILSRPVRLRPRSLQ